MSDFYEIKAPLEEETAFAPLQTFRQKKDHNSDITNEELFFYDEENGRLIDAEEMINEWKFKSNAHNIDNNEGLDESAIIVFGHISKSKDSGKDKLYVNEKKNDDNANDNWNLKEEDQEQKQEQEQEQEKLQEQKEEKRQEQEQRQDQEQKQKQMQGQENKDNGIESIEEENAFNEPSKEISHIEIKKEENIMEVKKEENIMEVKKEENIVGNNSNENNILYIKKNKKNLFKISKIFNSLNSLEVSKSKKEKSQRQMIRGKFKEIKKAIKENKIKNISYSFNQDIFFNSKEEDKKDKNIEIKKKKKRKRIFDPDNIIKKIQAKLSKTIITCLNEDLKRADSKEFFVFLPKSFAIFIRKKENAKSVLNMTFEQLIKKDFSEECKIKNENNVNLCKKRNRDKKDGNKISNKEIQNNSDKKKYQANIKILDYLKENKEISYKINFDNIKKMTYSDILKEYLESQEFEEAVLELLTKENVTQKYIIKYLINAFSYIDNLSRPKKKSTI